jgi:L-idonate 5-dehydrogenase
VRVALGAGGICGSDLHYWREGGIGDFPVREPLVLGHEMAGTVVELGPGIAGPGPGTRVAVNPTVVPAGCPWALRGQGHLSPQVRFAGSSRTFPHVQGLFMESVVVEAGQLVPVPDGLDLAEAAMAEPLAVCLHAVRRAGEVLGRTVLVTGAGPIGCLAMMAARLAGAATVIATDIAAPCLAKAREVAADQTIDVALDRGPLDALQAGGGMVDVVIECSGAPSALLDGLRAVRRGGTFVQLGVLPKGSHPVPIDLVVGKELAVMGSFRFLEEFGQAVLLLGRRRIDVRPLLSATLPLARAVEAFALAADRSRAMKVQLVPA